MSSKVYFTNNLFADGLKKVFDALNIKFNGKLAVKVHSGEKGNQNFLRPEFFKDFLTPLNGTIVECNTAYDGARNTTEKHKELIKEHGWDTFFPVDIMDEDGSAALNVENGKFLKKILSANIC